jgi:CO/xanthine dehydrogenase Mo-binding subunit
MNELADQLKIDPVRLRVLNEPKIDEGLGIPFSSRHFLECLDLGAEKFGWSKRNPEVGLMKRDGLTLGWGMAGCAWIALRFPAEANLELRDDGSARVACGTQDIGTGTYTILAQLASEKTGVPLDKVEVALGDTSLPEGPVEVTWQPEIARLRVSRVVTVIDAGRIINPLAGRNQIEGAVVMGIGMALLEHTSYDPQNGAPINSNLADYIMAVNADVPSIDVHFLDYPDKEINELGARGIGEIGLAGFAAAITAAVHHATGVRARELPVKIEDLLTSSVLS